MRKRSFRIIAIASLVAISSVASYAGNKVPSGKSVIKSVQKAYKSLKTFSSDFRLETRLAMINEPDAVEGTIELGEKDQFRYETPLQIMVTDGKTLWRYSRITEQVIVENLANAGDDILPRQILFEYPKKFDVETVHEGSLSGRPVYRLDLLPKEDGTGVKKLTVWADAVDWVTRKIEFVDISDNTTTYFLTNVALNPSLSKDRFKLQIPENVNVIDLR